MRSVRSRVVELELDTSHFTGQRTWTDRALGEPVTASRSWAEVAERLGLTGGSGTTTIKGHVVRLRLDTSHFHQAVAAPVELPPASQRHLPQAGELIAAAWFQIRGCPVSWPLAPARYDFIAQVGSELRRVQVKTTTHRPAGAWLASLSTSERTILTYDPDELDYFFVVDGDLGLYLIPAEAVAGLRAISLPAYEEFRVSGLSGFDQTGFDQPGSD